MRKENTIVKENTTRLKFCGGGGEELIWPIFWFLAISSLWHLAFFSSFLSFFPHLQRVIAHMLRTFFFASIWWTRLLAFFLLLLLLFCCSLALLLQPSHFEKTRRTRISEWWAVAWMYMQELCQKMEQCRWRRKSWRLRCWRRAVEYPTLGFRPAQRRLHSQQPSRFLKRFLLRRWRRRCCRLQHQHYHRW